MQIVQTKDYAEMSRRAALCLASEVAKNPHCVLMLPTGSTPEGTYQALGTLYREGFVSFQNAVTFNIDEYVGLSADDPHSYHAYMQEKLFSCIDILPHNTFIPDGNALDLQKEAEAYEQKIASVGGIDVLLLAIGGNGHIGFNEPSEAFSRQTGVVSLSEDTIRANARFFQNENDVPKRALCVGVGTMMQAKKIIFLCSGRRKKKAFAAMLNGPVTPHLPGSILQMHPDVCIFHTNFEED